MRRLLGGGVGAAAVISGGALVLVGPGGWLVLVAAGGLVSAGATGVTEAASTTDEEYSLGTAALNATKSFAIGAVSTGLCASGGQAVEWGGKVLMGVRSGAQLSGVARVGIASATKGAASGLISTGIEDLADTLASEKESQKEKSYLRSMAVGAVGGTVAEGIGTFLQKRSKRSQRSWSKAE